MRAQVSVGRLGIITELEFELLPQQNLTRLGHSMAFTDFELSVLQLQEDYAAALNGTGNMTIDDVLEPWEGTQARMWLACTRNSAQLCRQDDFS